MTRRERIEARIERRREWAESREKDAANRFGAARKIADNIPFGQPILVGHHSERHARRDAERIHNNMAKGCESADMARHHESKAANLEYALERSIFSDDDNAIEALEAKIADLEAERARIVALNKLIRKEFKADLPDGWMDRICATPAEKQAILNNVAYGWRKEPMFPSYVTQNISGRIQQAKKRIENIKAQNADRERAETAGGVSIVTNTQYGWATVTFAEKPERSIIDALKAANFHWSSGSWHGSADKLPDCVKALGENA